MGRFEICQVNEVPFASDRPLHRDQISQRADRGIHPIDATSLCARQKIREGEGSRSLREEIELAMRGGQVDRPISGDPTLGDRRAVGSGGAPPVNQRADPLDIVGTRVEHRIDISRRPHDSMPNQRDSANQHVADACSVEVVEDATEAGQRADASSAARTLSAMPLASSSSGSREASSMRRYRRHSSPARASSPQLSASRAWAPASISRLSEDALDIKGRIASRLAADRKFCVPSSCFSDSVRSSAQPASSGGGPEWISVAMTPPPPLS